MLKPGDKRTLGEGLDAKASISPDSLIGASARVGEKSTIKKSAIGKHCTIGKNVRIVGSVIGDHCTIEEG
jgi:translation initiation factor eIF-2B subunit gamma